MSIVIKSLIKLRKWGFFFEKDEIFTSFYNEFLLFWNWESEYPIRFDVDDFYINKFRKIEYIIPILFATFFFKMVHLAIEEEKEKQIDYKEIKRNIIRERKKALITKNQNIDPKQLSFNFISDNSSDNNGKI